MTKVSFCSQRDFKDPNAITKKSNVVSAAPLHRRRSVGVAEHRVEGMSKVVGLSAVVLLGHRQQEGEDHEQEQEELEGQRDPEDAPQKRGPTSRRRVRVRRGGSGSNVAARPVVWTAHRGSRL